MATTPAMARITFAFVRRLIPAQAGFSSVPILGSSAGIGCEHGFCDIAFLPVLSERQSAAGSGISPSVAITATYKQVFVDLGAMMNVSLSLG
ncbi:MAG: hypothetical protein OXF75_01095 [Acidimicrobiaceae bacterium]|nr:hypothetical protein [Acidimicrobiaceae bacterium]